MNNNTHHNSRADGTAVSLGSMSSVGLGRLHHQKGLHPQLTVRSANVCTNNDLPYNEVCTLTNTGSLEGTLQFYYHATPIEPLQGSPGVAW